MYARLSTALLARTTRASAAAAPAEPAYVMECGTISTATWPPTAAPLVVTATSVVPQPQPLPPTPPPPATSSDLLPPLSVARAVLDATSAHPRHPLRMALSRSPMWYAATTRSQRGYALGRSTLNFTTKSFVVVETAAEPAASVVPSMTHDAHAAAAPPAAEASSAGEVLRTVGSEMSSSSCTTSSSADANAPSSVPGTVMLPKALVFSFKGNPHEFQDRLRGANVLVFFYKAVCGPCAAIRSKLIHAVTDHFPMDANSFIHGLNGKKAAALTAQHHQQSEGGCQPESQQQQQQQAQQAAEVASSASGGTVSPTAAHLRGHKECTPPSDTEADMAVEDKAACELACRTLEDVAKAFPHRMIFLTVDTNENAKLTALHDIRSLPTFVAYRNGRMVGRVEGVDEQEVSKLVHSITQEDTAAQGDGAEATVRNG